MKKRKNYKELEKIVKGFSNHRRIEIMEILHKKPGLSLFEIAEYLDVNFRTISEHTRRLVVAGLIFKRADINFVRHELTRRGKAVLVFLGTLE
ncbi:MAG: hypothetical protein Athens071416_291 [Parcubacteria group bacterium Athens0714_16]|nr:MAG: hypothetical protein Athens071416_291 [Parcubacteria group bacterium Athens0714_16]